MCVLRVGGKGFDVDGFLASSPFKPVKVRRQGERRFRKIKPTELNEDSTFNLVVSEADGGHVPVQAEEALAFLRSNREELTRLMAYPGVEGAELDFRWDFPYKRVVAQYNQFSVELLAECAALRIAIEVSVSGVEDAEAGDSQ